MKEIQFYILLLALFAVGCTNVSRQQASPKKFLRLDKSLATYSVSDNDSVISFEKAELHAVKKWFELQGVDTLSNEIINAYSASKAMTMFMPDVDAMFLCIDSLESVLAQVDENMSQSFSGYRPLLNVAVVSPYNQSIFISDTLMFVGLNHYLGENYKGYSYFEEYQRQVKTPQHLPYDVAEVLIRQQSPFNIVDNATVLNRMLYEGAVVYGIMQLVPQASLSEALGYTASQLEWVEENESHLWKAMIARELLYSSSQVDAARLFNPSPATTLLHQECPGRVARYIGYKILLSYIQSHSDVKLSWLLSPSFYAENRSLIDSKYKASE